MERNIIENNRRRDKRLKINLAAWYKVVGPVEKNQEEVEVEMLDLSAGGMSFMTKDNIPARSTLLIKFVLFKLGKDGHLKLHGPVKLAGEVRSSKIAGDHQHRLGVYFKEVSLDDQGRIKTFVDATRSKLTK